ncbi:hypothetical protein AB1278_17620 [Chryseobacterium sp. NRRL B-14798]|uniref:hypothetical protein n=1 Tax=Chryseobacterium sp. NRRL B-14798 TaxID=3162880 RepID=UPI003D1A6D4A
MVRSADEDKSAIIKYLLKVRVLKVKSFRSVPARFSRAPEKISFIRSRSLQVDKKDSALYVPAAGNRNNTNGSLNSRGNNGNYWSSTQNTSTNAYNLNFNSSSVNVNNNNRTNGFSVRCITAPGSRYFLRITICILNKIKNHLSDFI